MSILNFPLVNSLDYKAVFVLAVVTGAVLCWRLLFSRTARSLAALTPFTLFTYAGIIFCGFFLILCYQFSFWPHMGIENMLVDGVAMEFADLHGVISASDCYRMGVDVYISNPCDQWNRVHAYGSPWLGLSSFGIDGGDLISLAVMLDALFLIVAFVIINPGNMAESVATCALILSPAVVMAFERANVDLLLFVGICFAGVLAARSRVLVAQLFAAFVIAWATILKIYPLFTFFALVVRRTSFGHMLWVTILFVSMVTIWYYFHPLELEYIFAANPKPHGSWVFGGGELFYLLFDSDNYGAILVVATIISILAGYFYSRKLSDLGEISKQNTNLYLMGLSVLAATFYFTNNYDYRCIFFLMCLPALLKMRTQQSMNEQTRLIANSSIILAVLAFWADFPLFWRFAVSDYAEQIISWVLLTNMVAVGFAMLRYDKGWISQKVFTFIE